MGIVRHIRRELILLRLIRVIGQIPAGSVVIVVVAGQLNPKPIPLLRLLVLIRQILLQRLIRLRGRILFLVDS